MSNVPNILRHLIWDPQEQWIHCLMRPHNKCNNTKWQTVAVITQRVALGNNEQCRRNVIEIRPVHNCYTWMCNVLLVNHLTHKPNATEHATATWLHCSQKLCCLRTWHFIKWIPRDSLLNVISTNKKEPLGKIRYLSVIVEDIFTKFTEFTEMRIQSTHSANFVEITRGSKETTVKTLKFTFSSKHAVPSWIFSNGELYFAQLFVIISNVSVMNVSCPLGS